MRSRIAAVIAAGVVTLSPVAMATVAQAAPSPTSTVVAQAHALTTEQRNAIRQANQYLRYSPFSKEGLYHQLRYEKYSKSAARKAVNVIPQRWRKQAARHAKQYLRYSPFSRQSLYDQLRYERYTKKQARYGVRKAY